MPQYSKKKLSINVVELMHYGKTQWMVPCVLKTFRVISLHFFKHNTFKEVQTYYVLLYECDTIDIVVKISLNKIESYYTGTADIHGVVAAKRENYTLRIKDNQNNLNIL